MEMKRKILWLYPGIDKKSKERICCCAETLQGARYTRSGALQQDTSRDVRMKNAWIVWHLLQHVEMSIGSFWVGLGGMKRITVYDTLISVSTSTTCAA